MTVQQKKRLADIHAQWIMWSAVTDTSSWEATFFFQLLEKKNREIAYWKKRAKRLKPSRFTS